MDVVFFVYGLPFVAMGLAILLQQKEGSAFKWSGTLWMLAGFALIHGINEWLDMWVIIKGINQAVDLIRWFCLAGSFVFLFEFGRRVLRISIGDSQACRAKAVKYMGWWLIAGAVGIVLFAGIAAANSGSTVARYVLGFPGSLMAAYGFYSYYRCEKDLLSKINVRKYFIISGMAFFIYAFLGGLVVPKGGFFPSNIINYDSFLQVTGIPVQVFRACVAAAIALSMINILKIFNWEITNRQKENLLRLQVSEDKYKTLIETIPDIVYCVDKDGNFTFVNNAIIMLGYDPDELIGQHFSKIIVPEEIELVSRNIVLSKPVDNGSQPKLFDERRTGARCTYGLEVHIVKKKPAQGPSQGNGQNIIVGEVNSCGVYEINGVSMEKEFAGSLGLIKTKPVGGSAGVIRDITKRKREMDKLVESQRMMEEVAQDLQKMINEEIRSKLKREQILVQQSKLATMGEMIALIAHQWKQPLNIIGLTVQDLEDAYDYEGLTREYIDKMVNNVMEQIGFMTKTISDFSSFLRPSKEKIRFCAVKAIEEVLFMNKSILERNDIIVSFYKENLSEDYGMTGYTNEFKHVILNLINNARDAILSLDKKDNKLAGRINIGITKKDNTIKITISDNGGGIPPEIIGKIFEPYFTTKPEQEGTGIGLYMSKTIIENRMGGKLSVRNIENGIENGAEFSIELQAERNIIPA
ncbi:MAG: PAS domain S-box protein [Nitrospirae bacterium]|nr:PAS domain S-box protein [Nitrospirota bacterium]